MSNGIVDRTSAAARSRTATRPPRAAAPWLPQWHVVIPVKGGADAKSRLRAPDGVDRVVLARAFALDTVLAAGEVVGVERVVVVTSDPHVESDARRAGASTVPDPGLGLNAAIGAGLDDQRPDELVGVLLGDLPALRPDELTAALGVAATHERAFLPDAEGAGTVLLTGRTAAGLVPRFGPGSAQAHELTGAARLELPLPGLRRDVDDETSLREALALGVGRHTAALLAHLITPAG